MPGPIDRPISTRDAAAAAPSSLALSHPPGGGKPFLAPLLTVLLLRACINIDPHGSRPTVLPRSPATPPAPSLGFQRVTYTK